MGGAQQEAIHGEAQVRICRSAGAYDGRTRYAVRRMRERRPPAPTFTRARIHASSARSCIADAYCAVCICAFPTCACSCFSRCYPLVQKEDMPPEHLRKIITDHGDMSNRYATRRKYNSHQHVFALMRMHVSRRSCIFECRMLSPCFVCPRSQQIPTGQARLPRCAEVCAARRAEAAREYADAVGGTTKRGATMRPCAERSRGVM
jgi:hypothetical protein